MENFYQSDIWKNICKDVMNKPIFEISFIWKNYFWVIKEKLFLWINYKWYQIMWIELWEKKQDFEYINQELSKLKRDFNVKFWDIFFQLWFNDLIYENDINNLKEWDILKSIRKIREQEEKFMHSKFWLRKSFRENMPLASIVYDLTIDKDNIYSQMSKSAHQHIKKWVSKWLYFELACEKDRYDFYEIWKQTSIDKKFNIISIDTYIKLKNYLLEKNYWKLFLVKKDWQIVSWSICIFFNDWLYYLYWATNRNFWNVWWHHLLKREIFYWCKTNWINFADLLWVSPSWYDDHHLKWVSNFKESLWWKKIEYLWNFDLVFNFNLYEWFKLMKGW